MMSGTSSAKTGLTPKQQQWFAAVKEGLERETGKSFDEWVSIAKTCPETKPRARQQWFKKTHGLGINRASVILAEAFGGLGWDQPDQLEEALWQHAAPKAILAKLKTATEKLEGTVLGQRKGFTAWSRKFQYAAARPVKDTVRLGLAIAPETDAMLQPAKTSDGWSERLKSVCVLEKPADVNAPLRKLLKASWELS